MGTRKHEPIDVMKLGKTQADIDKTIYAELIAEGVGPKPYKSPIYHIELPVARYSTADAVLEAYDGTKNNAKRSLILGSMSEGLRKNESEMFKIVNQVPEAIGHVDKSVLTPEFAAKVLHDHPQAYEFLPSKIQQQREVVDAYVMGMITNGCTYLESVYDGWQDHYNYRGVHLPMYKYAVSKDCDPEHFYSVQNYQKACEQIIKEGRWKNFSEGTYQYPDEYMQYHPATAYLHMAHIENRNNEMQLAWYQVAEALAVVNCSSRILNEIAHAENLESKKREIEMLMVATDTLRHPPEILGIDPIKEGVESLEHTINSIETWHYGQRGVSLRESWKHLCNVGLENYDPSDPLLMKIDHEMEIADEHPEMKLEIGSLDQNWWEYRGECLQTLRELPELNDIQKKTIEYLEDMSTKHPNMELGVRNVMRNREMYIIERE